jgi:predicted Zn finger-like uncharacterized protein
MKIICDNCATKYSIADEKVRGKVFKIRCKKCSHIIVVRGQEPEAAPAPADAAEDPARGFDQKETRVFDYSGFDTAGAAADPAAAAPAAAAAAPAPAASGETPVWHVVVDREQVGPMTASEVRERFARGEIDAETYAWREGFEDWIRLASIEDFAELFAGTAAFPSPFQGDAGESPAAGLAAAAPPDDGADLFGERPQAAPETQREPFAAPDAGGPVFASTPARSADLFAAAGGLGGEAEGAGGGDAGEAGGGMFGAPAAAPASPRIGEVRPMTGQRNENSVLFSLSNLSAIATGGGPAVPAAAPKPGFATSQSEGSGLIDIRAMAAQTLTPAKPADGASGGLDDIPSFAPSFSPVAAPVLLPTASEGMPKWVWPVIGVGGALVLAIVVMVVMLIGKPKPVQVAPTGTIAAATGAGGATPTAGAPGELGAPSASGAKVAAADTKAAGEAPKPTGAAAETPKSPEKPAAEPKKGAEKERPAAAAKADKPKHGGEPAAPAAPKEPKEPKSPKVKEDKPAGGGGGKKDELDCLLDPAKCKKGGGGKPAGGGGAKADSGGGDAKDRLEPSDIQKGMRGVKGRVQACYDQYKVPGMVQVSVTISPAGRVSGANVTGKFAGTPTGSCVAGAVRGAKFDRFRGGAITITYPFVLR